MSLKSQIRELASLPFNLHSRKYASISFSTTARILAVILVTGCALVSAQTLTTLYNFGSRPGDGENPQAGVVFDNAGNLYGTTALGGIGSDGTLFQLSPPVNQGGPWTETIIRRLRDTPDGASPEGRVVVNSKGGFFTTAYSGGATDQGAVLAAFPPVVPGGPWTEKVLYSFGSVLNDGLNPNSGVIASKHVLYGTTSNGGAKRRGTVFQLTPPAVPSDPWIETILHSFNAGGDAAFPLGELIIDSNGNLFGVTVLGGADNVGAVYEVSPPAVAGDPWTEQVVYSFSGPDGSSPFGRLLLGPNGVLYGTTSGGGAGEAGTVFQLTPPAAQGDPWTQTILYSFTGARDGGSPSAGVIMGKGGRLFGTARTGGSGGPDFGGVVFVLEPPANAGDPWTERPLVSFGGPNGFGPTSTLVLRPEGLYGTTTQGGAFGTGTVFLLAP